jgi:hypothetical protein
MIVEGGVTLIEITGLAGLVAVALPLAALAVAIFWFERRLLVRAPPAVGARAAEPPQPVEADNDSIGLDASPAALQRRATINVFRQYAAERLARGFVLHEGRWVTPDERQALLRSNLRAQWKRRVEFLFLDFGLAAIGPLLLMLTVAIAY